MTCISTFVLVTRPLSCKNSFLRFPSHFPANPSLVSELELGRAHFAVQVGFVALAAVTSVIALALLFVFSTLNVAFASFFMAFSTVCFIVAFFFSSVTVVYVGALGFGGLTIGSIAFFSVWAVIILSGEPSVSQITVLRYRYWKPLLWILLLHVTA